jgi:hypothetical protein
MAWHSQASLPSLLCLLRLVRICHKLIIVNIAATVKHKPVQSSDCTQPPPAYAVTDATPPTQEPSCNAAAPRTQSPHYIIPSTSPCN